MIPPLKKVSAYAYFLTFRCYGTLLHGETEHSVDDLHNQISQPFLKKNLKRAQDEKNKMQEAPYFLDKAKRQMVLDSILETCKYRRWKLFAAHVRSNHVHVVVRDGSPPERILSTLKSYATRKLKNAFPEEKRSRFWSHHGSTRYLFSAWEMFYTVRYVAEEQGEPMALYVDQNGTGILK